MARSTSATYDVPRTTSPERGLERLRLARLRDFAAADSGELDRAVDVAGCLAVVPGKDRLTPAVRTGPTLVDGLGGATLAGGATSSDHVSHGFIVSVARLCEREENMRVS